MNRNYPIEMAGIEFSDFCRDNFFCPSGDTIRLRKVGLTFFEKYFDNYPVSWHEEKKVDNISSKHLVWLAQHCKSLYYIGSKHIVLFDQEEAFLFQLLDADLDDVAKSGGM
jgi:hypothetical protein